MAELTVDMTYGAALLEAARDTGKEEAILEEGQALVELLKSETELKKFIEFPGISAVEKKKVITDIFDGRICRELLNFMYVLLDKRRAGRLEGIMKVYKKLHEREEGVSYGIIYSVTELSDDQLRTFEEQTGKLLQTKVSLENELDEKLMAGVRIQIEGKMIDASYRKKFDELASQMRIS